VKRVVYPGSFDPVTNGHLDIIKRASDLFDEVVVAVLVNKSKKTLFTVEERMGMISETTSRFGNVKVDNWSGLLVDYCVEKNIPAIVKGLRAISDFDYELQMSQINYQLKGIETLFISTAPAHSFLSSSLIKEILSFGGDVSAYMPNELIERVRTRLIATL
jgi:pantetheine-phosphate adenylyltransferase